MGYVLAPRMRGLGYASEVASAIADWYLARPATGLATDLHAWVFAEHSASRYVLEKVGFELVGVQLSVRSLAQYIKCR